MVIDGDRTHTSLRSIPPVVMAVFLVITVVPILAEAASFNIVYNSGVRFIEPEGYLLIKGVKAMEDAGISCNVTVFNGPNIDVLVMDKANFESYKQGAPFSYLGLSQLNVSTVFIASGVGELVAGTEYYLVIDNSNRPAGGASPIENGRAQVVYEFGAGNVQIVDSGFSVLFLVMIVALVAAVIVVIVILVLVMRNNGRRHQTGPDRTYSGSKVCPRCGMLVSVEHQFCPNCGNDLR